MDGYSVREAAEQLGVNRARVQAMIQAGQLAAAKHAGRWIIPSAEVHRRHRSGAHGGRPWGQSRAWQFLLDLACGSSAVEELRKTAWCLRRRASISEFAVLPELREDLLNDPRVVLGGSHAAERLGSVASGRWPADVYVRQSDLRPLVKQYHLIDPAMPSTGSLVVHVVDDLPDELAQVRCVPAVVAWLDLHERGDRVLGEVEYLIAAGHR